MKNYKSITCYSTEQKLISDNKNKDKQIYILNRFLNDEVE